MNSKMALSGINFNSEDFEWSRAPLASMEDLSQVNTPIPTPTAGQSPKTKSRWSHRYSQMSLDNVLGPINEIGEEEQEAEDTKPILENVQSHNIDKIPPTVKMADPIRSPSLNSFSLDPKSHSLQEQTSEQVDVTSKSRQCPPILKNGNLRDVEKLRTCVSPCSNDNSAGNFHTDVNRNNTEDQSNIDHSSISNDRYNVINELDKIIDQQTPSLTSESKKNDDIVEDPLSHIQWPKSAYQTDSNYSVSMSPFPPLLASPQAQIAHRTHDPQMNYRKVNMSSPRWRTCEVIPEEENMQIFTASQYEDRYMSYQPGYTKETDNLLLRPRQVQFISPKHKRKSIRQYQVVGAAESNPIYSPGVVRSQRAFVQPKNVSEMDSLIRANDGSIDGAKCHIEPKDR